MTTKIIGLSGHLYCTGTELECKGSQESIEAEEGVGSGESAMNGRICKESRGQQAKTIQKKSLTNQKQGGTTTGQTWEQAEAPGPEGVRGMGGLYRIEQSRWLRWQVRRIGASLGLAAVYRGAVWLGVVPS